MNSKIKKSTAVFAVSALGIMLTGGCASQGNSSVSDSGTGSKQVCTYSSSFGSRVGFRHCTSRSRYKAKQKAEHKQVKKSADAGAGAGTGGGRL